MNKGNEEISRAFLKKKRAFFSKLTRALWFSSFVMMSLLMIQESYAATSTWSALPANNNWNDGNNWSLGVPTDVAEFNSSTQTSLILTAAAPTVNQIVFNMPAPSYTINPNGFTLEIFAPGVTNNSGVVQTFNISGGTLRFDSTGSAANTSIINGSTLQFVSNSNAGTSTITNNGTATFSNNATASNSTITNNGTVIFNSTASSGEATVINNLGGTVSLFQNTTFGSLSGAGNISLFNPGTGGSSTLTTGVLGNTETISGVISGVNSSFVKTGEGILTLSGANTYTGLTTVGGGELKLTGSLGGGVAVLSAGTFIVEGATLTVSNAVSNSGTTNFTTTASAGNSALTNNGSMTFVDSSKAGTAHITNNDGHFLSFVNSSTAEGSTIANDGTIIFANSSEAGTAKITNNAGRFLTFIDASTAEGSTITNNGITNFFNTSTADSSVITNTGTLNFNSTANSGGATVANNLGGTVALGANTTLGSLSGAGSVNLGSFNLTMGALGNTETISGVISGVGGSLTKLGTGNLVFTGANNIGGGITNSAGILTGNAASLNAPTIQNNAALVFNQITNGTFAGIISGGGTFQKLGTGNLVLTGANNIGGGITNSAGILTGNIASLNTPTIQNNAALVFNQITNGTFAGIISGVGTFQKLGTGNLTLTGANNIGGGITNSAGILTGNAASLNTPTLQNNATLVFNQITNGTFAGAISGGGTFQKLGGGNLILTGINSFDGGITNSAGILTGNTASLNAPTIQNNATLVFNQITNGIFAGAITGAGFTKMGPGVLTMTGNYSGLTGSTTIAEGEVVFTQAAPNAIALPNANSLLDFSAPVNTAISYGGAISGIGNVELDGPGKVTFTGTQTYTGSTSVNQGTFVLNGSLPNSAVTVANGATLMGSGSMDSLNLFGTISPGNSIGTLNIANNFTMAPTATYFAEVEANGTSDLIAVGGQAQLNGTLNVATCDCNRQEVKNKTFTILTAAQGVAGQFSSLISTDRLKYTVQYLSNSVTVLVNALQDFTDAFAPTNQTNAVRTARYFDTFADTVPTTSDLGGVIAILDGMLALDDTAGLTNAFNQIQPSQYRETGMLSFLNSELVSKTIQTQQQYLRETHRLETELKQLEGVSSERVVGFQKLVNDVHSKGFNFTSAKTTSVGPRKSALAFLAPHGAEGSGMPGNQRIRFGDSSAWFQSYGQVHEKNSSHGNKGIRSRTGGISMGADHQVYKNTFVGLFGGFSTTPFEWKGGRGSGHMKSYYGGMYGTWMDDCGLYVDGQVIAGQDRFNSHRNIKFATINRKAKENHHGNQFSVDTEVGYAWGLPFMTVQPYIDASYMFVRENGFTEKGANSLDFKIKGKTSQFARGAVGTQFYRTFVTCDTLIRPAIQLAYVHKQPLGHHEAIKGGLVNEPQTLSVLGDNKKRNQFAPGASLTAQFNNGMYVIANVSGEIFSGQNAGEALVRVGYDF